MKHSTKDLLDSAARKLVTSAVILALWLFGGAEPWSYLLLSLLSLAAMLVWLLGVVRHPPATLSSELLPFVFIWLLLLIQVIPLPAQVLRLLSPLASDHTENLATTFRQAGLKHFLLRPDGEPWGTLSLCAGASRRALYLFTAYAGILLVLCNTVRTLEQLRKTTATIVISGFLMALLALIHHFSLSEQIFWLHTPRFGGAVFGPFTNRNHFAAHANMLLGAALGLLLFTGIRLRQTPASSWRDWFRQASSPWGSGAVLAMFATVLLAVTVCVTLSRGGMISLFGTTALFVAAVAVRKRLTPSVLLLLAALLAGAMGLIYWLGDAPVVKRLGTLGEVALNPAKDLRLIVTRDTLRVFAAFPIIGCGFGTFRHVFSAFQSPSLEYRWLHAHNDWAQLLAEGGLCGTLLFLIALFCWIRTLRRQWPTASRRARLVATGLCFGIVTLALHSLVDYSLHKSSNALLLSALAGLTLAAVRIRRSTKPHTREVLTGETSPHSTSRAGGFVALVSLTILLVAVGMELRQELAFARFEYLRKIAARTLQDEEFRQTVDLAAHEALPVIRNGERNPDSAVAVAHALLEWCADERIAPGLQRRLAALAREAAARAAFGAPSDYLAWLGLARTEAALGEWDGAELALARARNLVGFGQKLRMFEPTPGTGPLKQIP